MSEVRNTSFFFLGTYRYWETLKLCSSLAQNLHFNLIHCVFFLKADQFFTPANSWTSEAVSSCSSARRESMRGMRQTKFMSNLGL